MKKILIVAVACGSLWAQMPISGTPGTPSSGPGSGTVTSVATGCGLAGGPITATGTISQTVATAAHNGSYAILTGDCGKSLTTNTAAAWTIAQAGTTGFAAGWFVIVNNIGSGSLTVTATTSTFYGGPSANISGSVLTVPTLTSATIISDGTNYQVLSGGGGGGAVPITSNAIPKGTGTSIAASGCSIDSSNNLSCPGKIASGGAATGALNLSGSTSGLGTVTVNDIAGSWNMVLPANTGSTTAHFVLENTDGAGATAWVASNAAMAIGGAVSSGTSGSVLYVDGSGNLAQKNSNFIFDATNLNLFVGYNAGGTNAGVRLGNILGDTGFPGIWFGQLTPSFTNYSFLNDPTVGTIFNAPSGLAVALRVANSTIVTVKSASMKIGGAMSIIPDSADQEIYMGAADVTSPSSANYTFYKNNSGDFLINVPTAHRTQFRVNNVEVGFTGTCTILGLTAFTVLGGIVTGCS